MQRTWLRHSRGESATMIYSDILTLVQKKRPDGMDIPLAISMHSIDDGRPKLHREISILQRDGRGDEQEVHY